MIKVMKFGGTSLGGVEAIERTASIISRESAKKVVVVSAMSGVTNSLINGLRERRPISDIIGDPQGEVSHLRQFHLRNGSIGPVRTGAEPQP